LTTWLALPQNDTFQKSPSAYVRCEEACVHLRSNISNMSVWVRLIRGTVKRFDRLQVAWISTESINVRSRLNSGEAHGMIISERFLEYRLWVDDLTKINKSHIVHHRLWSVCCHRNWRVRNQCYCRSWLWFQNIPNVIQKIADNQSVGNLMIQIFPDHNHVQHPYHPGPRRRTVCAASVRQLSNE
jgi:hypothetical protein